MTNMTPKDPQALAAIAERHAKYKKKLKARGEYSDECQSFLEIGCIDTLLQAIADRDATIAKLKAAARNIHEKRTAERDSIAQKITEHFAELQVKSLRIEEGHVFDAVFTGEFLPIFAQLMCDLFENAGGKNYVEWTITHPRLGALLIRIQRREGKEPSEVAAELRAEVARLTAERDEAAAEAARREREKNIRFLRAEAIREPCNGPTYRDALESAADAIAAGEGGDADAT